jgi:hypothetical protein
MSTWESFYEYRMLKGGRAEGRRVFKFRLVAFGNKAGMQGCVTSSFSN